MYEDREEVSRALDLIHFLGKLDKKDSELLVEFLEIKPIKIKSIKLAQKALEETQKTLLDHLKIKED